MRIAICDDDIKTNNYIEECLSEYPMTGISCDVFLSGTELSEYVGRKDGDMYNIIFMDIEMPGIDGIETARRIRALNSKILIIFITGHDKYVYNVFEVLPFRFLVKPLTKKVLDETLRQALEYIHSTQQMFFFKIDRRQYQIPTDRIIYFESMGRKIKLVSATEQYLFYDKMSNVLNRLDKNSFTQIHASFLVNMEYILYISETVLHLGNDITLPISRKHKNNVRTQHLQFMSRRCDG